MQSLELWFQYTFVAFAAAYVVIAVVRIVLQLKNMKVIAAASASQKQRSEVVAASSEKHKENARRLETLQQNQKEQHERAEELFRMSKETQERWSSVLSRLEALLEKVERKYGA